MAAASAVEGLDAAFRRLDRAPATGDLDASHAAMLPDAVILDEDLPFPLSRVAYADHWAFTLAHADALD